MTCNYSISEETGESLVEALWYVNTTKDTQIVTNAIAKYTLTYEENWNDGQDHFNMDFITDNVSTD